jgi:hypothetical protein
MLLCDNLGSHIAKDFINAMKPIGEVVFFSPNVTDLLQPGRITAI